jgi:hypothetical protein
MEDNIKWINNGIIDINEFSFEEIRKINDKLDWSFISYNQKLSEGFIREFADRVDWNHISYHQELSEGFIREFYDRVNWKVLDEFNKIKEGIFIKMNREQKLYMLINYREIWESYNGK